MTEIPRPLRALAQEIERLRALRDEIDVRLTQLEDLVQEKNTHE